MKNTDRINYQKLTAEEFSRYVKYLQEFAGHLPPVKNILGIGVIDEESGTPCGCVYARTEKSEGFMRVVYIMADPAYRRKGIGTKLVQNSSSVKSCLLALFAFFCSFSPACSYLSLHHGTLPLLWPA